MRVHASQTVRSFFAGIVGLDESTVQGIAAAEWEERDDGCGGYVVWAHGQDCKLTLDWGGGTGLLIGNVHSNASVKVGGTDKIISGVCEYVTTVDDNGSGITFVQVPAEDDYPIWWDIEDYRPGGRAMLAAQAEGKYFEWDCAPAWSPTGDPIPEGLHYCHHDVSIPASITSGTVTIVAEGRINVSNSGGNFTSYIDGLLFFSNEQPAATTECGTNVVDITGSGGSFTGFVFAPYGSIKYSGSGNHVLNGGLIGYTVDVSGNDFQISYQDDLCEDVTKRILVRLIQ
ncbi:MAG TPA: hypothetical protein VMY98_04160 [Anaerolineae bacterium]|nr:hypothetical protein [Anaerolineae bacterium]